MVTGGHKANVKVIKVNLLEYVGEGKYEQDPNETQLIEPVNHNRAHTHKYQRTGELFKRNPGSLIYVCTEQVSVGKHTRTLHKIYDH